MKKILTIIIATITVFSLLANLNLYVNADTSNPTALTVIGLVNNPLNLTLTQLQAMPRITEQAGIICVDFPDRIVEEGNWKGVKLSTLLQTAQIQSGAVKIAISANDGYSSDLTVEAAMEDSVILAYEKDGQALSGLRLVVPGRWGYKWVNQVTKIEAVSYDYLGFWESRGYSDTAIVGQGSGVQKPPQPKPSTSIPTPTVTPKPNPSTTPTPTPSQNTTTGTQTTQTPTTQNPNQTNNIPTEAVYAIAIGIIAAIAVATLVVRKKVKR